MQPDSDQLKALLQTLPSPFFASDATCTHITGNAAAYEMTGLHPAVKNLSFIGDQMLWLWWISSHCKS